MSRLPPWIRADLRTDKGFTAVNRLVSGFDLHTVCESARCPNKNECWNRSTATFMILGGVCTRSCRFCAVAHGQAAPPDPSEPARVAQAARELRLRHVVVTSVTRDDLPDGGAAHFAGTIHAVRQECPGSQIEVLTPDFRGAQDALARVLEAEPDVFAHNLETVERLHAEIRPQASSRRSLAVLRFASEWRPRLRVKSGLMLGLGETADELGRTLEDLLQAGCELLTLGQYLAPGKNHAPVRRFYSPDEFDAWAAKARNLGFAGVASGPMVRSSYRADALLQASREKG